jgi:F-type H+-transporting ATPase subunit gamma
MPTIEELKRKINTAEDLESVVKTMKTLAAVSIRQYEKAVASLVEYDRTVTMGFQILLQNHPEAIGMFKPTIVNRLGVVVFGSDWGMCGQFNEQIASFTLKQIDSYALIASQPIILTLGARIFDRLETIGYTCEACFNVPSSLAGITSIVQEIVLTLETWRREHHVNQILVIHHRPLSGANYHPNSIQIFPLNFSWLQDLQKRQWSSRSLPTFTLSSEKLAAALFREYFFVCLYRACAESLASENASRLAAMQMAEKNIRDRTYELKAELNHQRQTKITEELLDIVSGFEALNLNRNNP